MINRGSRSKKRGEIGRQRVLTTVGTKLMGARFQGITLGAASNGYGTINGTDSKTGWNWSTNTVFGAKPRIQYLGGNASASIVSTTDYEGVTSQVLQLVIAAQSGVDQCILLLEPTETITEYLQRGRLKLASNIASALGSGGWVACGPEMKTAGDYRVNCQIGIVGSTPRFNVAMDNNANGGLPPSGQMTNFYGSPVYNFDFTVPVGLWYQYELYFKRSDTAGRITWKINGSTVFDMDNIDTIGVNSALINRMMLGSSYASGGNVVQVDDVEMWDYSGVGGGGGSQNTTPQVLHLNSAANTLLTTFHNMSSTAVNTETEGAGGITGGAAEELLTNGTLAAQFITTKAPVGGFTLPAASTVSFRFSGNDPNNSGFRLRAKLAKRSAAGTETAIGTYNDDANLTSAFGAYIWSGTIASEVAFAEDDRLIVRFFIYLAAGGNVTGGYVSFSVGGHGNGNPSNITIPTTVAWKAAP